MRGKTGNEAYSYELCYNPLEEAELNKMKHEQR